MYYDEYNNKHQYIGSTSTFAVNSIN